MPALSGAGNLLLIGFAGVVIMCGSWGQHMVEWNHMSFFNEHLLRLQPRENDMDGHDKLRLGTGASDRELARHKSPPGTLGWICPVCGRGVSPDVETCNHE